MRVRSISESHVGPSPGRYQHLFSTCSVYPSLLYQHIRVNFPGRHPSQYSGPDAEEKGGGATEGGGALESMGVPLVSAKAERLELPGGARWERRLRCVDRRAAGLLRLTLTHMRRSVWTGGQWACSGSHSLT